MARRVPQYAQQFADALKGAPLKRLEIPHCDPKVRGFFGIRREGRIMYRDESFQLLGRSQEFDFSLPDRQSLSVSLQLYENTSGHWRLFAYTHKGMLLSVNLTLLKDRSPVFTLAQKLKLSTRNMTKEARAEATESMCEHLRLLGHDVDHNKRLILGTFNSRKGNFVDTSPEEFLCDFVVAAVVKGHFMANKDYSLPGLTPVKVKKTKESDGANKRSVPLGLRYQVLEEADGKCLLCGRDLSKGIKLHVDHIVPWSRGGKTVIDNLQALCQDCNLGKGNRSTKSFKSSSK